MENGRVANTLHTLTGLSKKVLDELKHPSQFRDSHRRKELMQNGKDGIRGAVTLLKERHNVEVVSERARETAASGFCWGSTLFIQTEIRLSVHYFHQGQVSATGIQKVKQAKV